MTTRQKSWVFVQEYGPSCMHIYAPREEYTVYRTFGWVSIPHPFEISGAVSTTCDISPFTGIVARPLLYFGLAAQGKKVVRHERDLPNSTSR
jgi:hypothetical protein